MLYTGDTANYQFLGYAVVDMPLLSNSEQCADACMRLRTEYLFHNGRYGEIRFNDVKGKAFKYTGGSSRKEFEKYLKRVYGVANIFSLNRELQPPAGEVQPGDLFVYAAADRPGNQYGHAVMVVDVAWHPCSGRKVLLLAEGNTGTQSSSAVEFGVFVPLPLVRLGRKVRQAALLCLPLQAKRAATLLARISGCSVRKLGKIFLFLHNKNGNAALIC